MATRILTWFLETPITVGNSQGPTYELVADATPVRVWCHLTGAPTGANLEFDITTEYEEATASIFTGGLAPGIQVGSRTGERDYFADPRIIKAGSLVAFNLTQIGTGEGGKRLTVQLELEELEQEK